MSSTNGCFKEKNILFKQKGKNSVNTFLSRVMLNCNNVNRVFGVLNIMINVPVASTGQRY